MLKFPAGQCCRVDHQRVVTKLLRFSTKRRPPPTGSRLRASAAGGGEVSPHSCIETMERLIALSCIATKPVAPQA